MKKMRKDGKMKVGKKYVARLGSRGEWIVVVFKNDKDPEEFTDDTFDLYFTARIPPDCKIKSDPGVFSSKMEELGWQRKKGSLFGKSGIVSRKLEMSLEKIKLFILTVERTKRLNKEIQDKELFHFLIKNGNGGSGTLKFLKDHANQDCLEIVRNLDNFSRQIMIEQSTRHSEIVCL